MSLIQRRLRVRPGIQKVANEVGKLQQSPSGYGVMKLRQGDDAINSRCNLLAVHEALEGVANIVDPNTRINKLTVLRSHHSIASITRGAL